MDVHRVGLEFCRVSRNSAAAAFDDSGLLLWIVSRWALTTSLSASRGTFSCPLMHPNMRNRDRSCSNHNPCSFYYAPSPFCHVVMLTSSAFILKFGLRAPFWAPFGSFRILSEPKRHEIDHLVSEFFRILLEKDPHRDGFYSPFCHGFATARRSVTFSATVFRSLPHPMTHLRVHFTRTYHMRPAKNDFSMVFFLGGSVLGIATTRGTVAVCSRATV